MAYIRQGSEAPKVQVQAKIGSRIGRFGLGVGALRKKLLLELQRGSQPHHLSIDAFDDSMETVAIRIAPVVTSNDG